MSKSRPVWPYFLAASLPGMLGAFAYTMFLRPQMLKWGARLGEPLRRLPGDDVIAEPTTQSTHAISIDAAPEDVWPWIAQMGREKSGWYSYERFNVGRLPSVTHIRDNIPEPRPGMRMDDGSVIWDVQPGRLLLFGRYGVPHRLGGTYDFSRAYLLEHMHDGTTRLLVRTRTYMPGTAGALYCYLIYEPMTFLFLARQLENVKLMAEVYAAQCEFARRAGL